MSKIDDLEVEFINMIKLLRGGDSEFEEFAYAIHIDFMRYVGAINRLRSIKELIKMEGKHEQD